MLAYIFDKNGKPRLTEKKSRLCRRGTGQLSNWKPVPSAVRISVPTGSEAIKFRMEGLWDMRSWADR